MRPAAALLDEQADEIERALWIAVRTLDERASVLASMVERAENRGRSADREREGAAEAADQAKELRGFLVALLKHTGETQAPR